MEATVNKIIPFSSVDGPGNRTAVFLQGCNFDCKYCHNPETIHSCVHCGACVAYCKTGALRMEAGRVCYDKSKCVLCDECFHHCPRGSSPRTQSMTPEQVMEAVRKNRPFIRGITVSGGECTLWRDFLLALLTLAKKEGLHTLLDSNGSYPFADDPALLAVTDGVMLDVKAWNTQDHHGVAGTDNEQVLRNLSFLAETGKLSEVRTVVVPQLFDPVPVVRCVAQTVSPLQERGNTQYKLIRYRKYGVRAAYADLTPPTDQQMQELAQLARSCGMKQVMIT